MKSRYKNLLEGLGYDVECLGAILISDLIDDVIELMKCGLSKSEIVELLPRYYLEHYHFDYEIGRNRYMNEIDIFLNSKKITKKTKIINKKFNLLYKNYNLEDLVIFLGKYFYNVDMGISDEIKVYKKRLVK